MWKGFQKPKRLAVDSGTLEGTYGRFSAHPFERGFGTTIGNSLRRALLSSIEGAAITAVRIENISHEFSPIPGVVEDATDIILNLKQIPLKLDGSSAHTIRLRATEPGEIYSSAIESDSDVTILDEEVYIATVSDGGVLDIEMRVKTGRGYVTAEKNFDEDLTLGYIPIDAVHTPVKRVKFDVEAARLGQMTDYEKLLLEVWTNGAISPQDAIALAAQLMMDHMQIFINFEEESTMEEVAASALGDSFTDYLNKSVDDLELSVRSYNCLRNANIQTLGDLVIRSENDMLKTKNFGRKSLQEIREVLEAMGLQFGMQKDENGQLMARSTLGHII